MNLYRDHSASTSLGKGEGVDEKSNKKWHRKEGAQPKKWCPAYNFFYVLFFVTQSLFLLGFSSSPDSKQQKEHIQESTYQYIWNNNKIFSQKYDNSTTLSMWVVYIKCVFKNSVASQDVIYYLDVTWCNVISWGFFPLIL